MELGVATGIGRAENPLVSTMDDDDVITAVLGQLNSVESFVGAACVNRQFSRLAALDLFWRELCKRRWELFPDAELFRAVAEADIGAEESQVQAPPAAAALWRR